MYYLTMHSTHFIYGYMGFFFWGGFCYYYLTTHSTHFIYGYMVLLLFLVFFIFNDALNTFYLPLYGGLFFNLTMHSTHFIYGYMASDIW